MKHPRLGGWDLNRAPAVVGTVADLSIDQVSEVLGKPVTAVKALQRRANATLSKRLGPR